MGNNLYETLPLEQLVTVHDKARKPVTKSDRKPGPYPYYGASGITDYVKDYIFDGDYVLLAEDGDNLRTRNTPIAFMAKGKFWVNNHAHIFKAKEGESSDYICYALQVADIASYISGSTRPKITQADMRKIPVSAPPLETRESIALILGSLDNKIQLNRQTNKTLEKMAQALFKSWFVDFDPVIDNALEAGNTIPDELQDRAERRQQQLAKPDHQPLPDAIRQLFPSEFELTEALGWVPMGWEAGTLANIASYVKERVHVSKLSLENYVSTENMNAEKSGIRYAASLPNTDQVSRFSSGETLISNIRPYFKKIWFANFNGGRSNDVLGFQAKNHAANEFLFNLLYQDTFFDYMTATAKGTKMPRGDKEAIMSWPSLIPPPKLMEKFSKIVKPSHIANKLRSDQSHTLSETRDTLLPKLISGELRLPPDAPADAEQQPANATS